MKNSNEYLIAVSAEDGSPRFVVEWNETTGDAKVTFREPVPNSHTYTGLRFKRGIEGYGKIEWSGVNFSVSLAEHQFFAQEYPDMKDNLRSEYVAADQWLTRKKKKIKDSYRFLLNWIRKARAPR